MLKLAKYIEKTGMNLSYMKNALRAARAAGVPILRSEDALKSHIAQNVTPSFLKKIPFIGERMHDATTNLGTNALTLKGPVAVPGHNFVYMPRSFTNGAGQNYSPRATLLHELGHIQHMQEDPKSFGTMGQLNRVFSSPVNARSRMNLTETIANNNAIMDMRAANVPEHLIDTYKTRVQSPFHNSYGLNLENIGNSPTGNMNLPRRILHGATQRLSDMGKNIAGIGKSFWQSFKKPKQLDANFSGTVPNTQASLPGPLRPYKPSADFMSKFNASLGKANNAAISPVMERPAHIPARQAEVRRFSSKATGFAPLKKIPVYTHPAAQEFNVPYSV
jgi:hypothetical protein